MFQTVKIGYENNSVNEVHQKQGNNGKGAVEWNLIEQAHFTQVDEKRNCSSLVEIKLEGTHRSGEGVVPAMGPNDSG